MVQVVKINGYDYYYKNGTLYEDEKCTLLVDSMFLTPNEKEQIELWIKYNNKPMLTFS